MWPSALAVWWLMTSSNFVGCPTGRSAGLAPFRIRTTGGRLGACIAATVGMQMQRHTLTSRIRGPPVPKKRDGPHLGSGAGPRVSGAWRESRRGVLRAA